MVAYLLHFLRRLLGGILAQGEKGLENPCSRPELYCTTSYQQPFALAIGQVHETQPFQMGRCHSRWALSSACLV